MTMVEVEAEKEEEEDERYKKMEKKKVGTEAISSSMGWKGICTMLKHKRRLD